MIVFLDAFTSTMDGMTLDVFSQFQGFVHYNNTSRDKIVKRCIDAEIIITNKVIIDKQIIDQLPNLRYICVCATGYNNVDVEYATQKNIPVSNVPAYSTDGVAQHVFAQVLHIFNHIAYYDEEVMNGRWSMTPEFTFYDHPIYDLAGKTMGIFGFGNIGQKVGFIAHAFGMNVIATHRHEEDKKDWVEFVDFETLCRKSDVMSLHASMNEDNKGIINKYSLANMKPSSVLVNCSRGGLIIENELANALESGVIRYACLDVLIEEPPAEDNPLMAVSNCVITPHLAWASVESRQRLLHGVADNIKSFKDGKGILNRVGLFTQNNVNNA